MPHTFVSTCGRGCRRGLPLRITALREAIAHHVSFTRAVACSADSIVVTQGAQQAFDLLARTLVAPGKTAVAVEHPGYEPQQLAFAAAGATMVPVRVDGEGLCVRELPPQVRVVSVSPSHQFPLGSVLSAARRAALIDFARLHRVLVIEDDYDGEFRFTGQPLDALQTLDRSGSVFYVGTFSKSMFAAMRIGFIVAPPWALPALVAAKRSADQHSDLVTQETLAAFIAEGHLARHVRKMRGLYAVRRQRLLDGLGNDFAPWLTPVPGAAGLHVAALARPGVDPHVVAQRARQAQIRLAAFGVSGRARRGQRGLLFGYGAIDEDAIGRGLAQLRRLMAS
jgi:GntR family transcriptional regulator / MocR family aminotransferase